jgi:hypothetical protein
VGVILTRGVAAAVGQAKAGKGILACSAPARHLLDPHAEVVAHGKLEADRAAAAAAGIAVALAQRIDLPLVLLAPVLPGIDESREWECGHRRTLRESR